MNNFSIDTTLVDNLFALLDKDNINDMLFSGLKEAGKLLQEKTKQSVISKMKPGAAESTKSWNKNMVQGVRLTNDKAYTTVVVSILGDFRLWIFENGTGLRNTDKGANRGSVSARNFFLEARNNASGDMENLIIQKVESELSKL